MTKKYFKIQNKLNLPLLIQIEDENLFDKLEQLLVEIGLVEMTHKDALSVKVVKSETTIVSLTLGASISSKYSVGEEVTYKSGIQYVYKHSNTSILLHSQNSVYWQMALVENAKAEDIKISMNRLICLALSKIGIIGFWGVKAQETILVTSKLVASADCIFIDYTKKKLFDSEQLYDLDSDLNIGRLDESTKSSRQLISRESLYSFLMTNNAFLSLEGMPKKVQDNIMKLALELNGYLYPERNFESRAVDLNPES